MKHLLIAILLFGGAAAAWSPVAKADRNCDVVLTPNMNVQWNLNNKPGTWFCLDGNFELPKPITIPSGKRLVSRYTAYNDRAYVEIHRNGGFVMKDNTRLEHIKIQAIENQYPPYAVKVSNATGVTVWGVDIYTRSSIYSPSGAHNVYAAVDVPILIQNGSNNVNISSVYIEGSGDPMVSTRNPAVRILDSSNVTIKYPDFGHDDTQYGIGSGQEYTTDRGIIGCKNTTGLQIIGGSIRYSGAAGISLKNCDDATIDGTTVDGSEWYGVAAICDSDNVTVTNASVRNSAAAAVLFHEDTMTGGRITSNAFSSNNIGGESNCAAIEMATTNDGDTVRGSNTNSDSGPMVCATSNIPTCN